MAICGKRHILIYNIRSYTVWHTYAWVRPCPISEQKMHPFFDCDLNNGRVGSQHKQRLE